MCAAIPPTALHPCQSMRRGREPVHDSMWPSSALAAHAGAELFRHFDHVFNYRGERVMATTDGISLSNDLAVRESPAPPDPST